MIKKIFALIFMIVLGSAVFSAQTVWASDQAKISVVVAERTGSNTVNDFDTSSINPQGNTNFNPTGQVLGASTSLARKSGYFWDCYNVSKSLVLRLLRLL